MVIGNLVKNPDATKLLVFGEIYSSNVGDGVIFECLRRVALERAIDIQPADISLRDGYGLHPGAHAKGEASVLRSISRYFVRRSLTLRRGITLARWVCGGRAKFIKKYSDAVRKADGIVIGGGQILVDRQLQFPLAISQIMGMARKANKPVAVFSCGADIEQGWIARRIFRNMIKEAKYISVRDKISSGSLQKILPLASINIHPDVGFMAGTVYPSDVGGCANVLGVNIMPYDTVAAFSTVVRNASHAEYVTFWRGLIRFAAEAGWTVSIMTNGDANDAAAAKEIYEGCFHDERIKLINSPKDPGELIEMLRGVQALVASRMHSGIVAYSLGKEVIPLVWDEKVVGVWSEVDPKVNLLEFDDIFSLSFENILNYLSESGGNYCNSNIMESVTGSVMANIDDMLSMFEKSGKK